MTTAEKGWLETLETGTEVAVYLNRYGTARNSRGRVERITATQIIVDGQRFRKTDGRLIGGATYEHKRLKPLDDSLMAEIRLAELRDWLNECATKKELSISTLEAMHAAFLASTN